mgnify:CR=1 FL=1
MDRSFEKGISDYIAPFQNQVMNEMPPFDAILPTLENLTYSRYSLTAMLSLPLPSVSLDRTVLRFTLDDHLLGLLFVQCDLEQALDSAMSLLNDDVSLEGLFLPVGLQLEPANLSRQQSSRHDK